MPNSWYAEPMAIIANVLHIAGSLGLLVYGMRLLSDGVQRAAGERLQGILNHLTTNRFAAIGTGFVVTALVQSSSATTVMVVSFVNAALLTLPQAIGAIMGANIGTTVTGWIVALLGFSIKIAEAALPAVGLGALLIFHKRLRRPDLGEALVGFGLLFLGLAFLKDAVPDVGAHPEVLRAIASLGGYGIASTLFFVLVGTLLTLLVQSSSAAMTITLTMAYAGWIDFQTAAAIVLGENIGTTVTANLAAMGGSVNGKRAARAHLIFNLVGVVWMVPLLPLVLRGIETAAAGTLLPTRLALFHTVFNVVNTALFVGFVPWLTQAVCRLVPTPPVTDAAIVSGPYVLPIPMHGTGGPPELYLVELRYEVVKMARIADQLVRDAWEGFRYPKRMSEERLAGMMQREEFTDQMQEQIAAALSAFSFHASREAVSSAAPALLRIVEELEHVADSAFNVATIADRRARKRTRIDREALEELEPYAALVIEFMGFVRNRLSLTDGAEAASRAGELEERVNTMRNKLKKSARRRIQQGASLKGELLIIDVVGHLEHIGDYALNIAQAIRAMNPRTTLSAALSNGEEAPRLSAPPESKPDRSPDQK